MKTRITLFLLLAIVAQGCSSSNNYSSLTKDETKEIVSQRIMQRDIVIDVDRAQPSGSRSLSLTGSYALRISGDSVYSHLPYFGRAYTLPYGGGEGLTFEGTAEDYAVGQGRKGSTEISFRVRTREDRYTFNVSLWPNGSTDVYVMPGNKQAITFTGLMRLEEKRR